MGKRAEQAKRKRILARKRARAKERYDTETAHREAKKAANLARGLERLANETPAQRADRLAYLAQWTKDHRDAINRHRREKRAEVKKARERMK